jgi:methionine biosynthesis protein MetW
MNKYREEDGKIPNIDERTEIIMDLLIGGERLLDIGCGDGSISILNKHKFREIHGIDISETALREAAEKEVIVRLINLNEQPIPNKNSYYDAILCMDLIEHVIDPLNVLVEIKRVLKHNGQLLLTTPNIRYFRQLWKLIRLGEFPHTAGNSDIVWGGGHIHYFTIKDITGLLEKAGFYRVKTHLNKRQLKRSWKRHLVKILIRKNLFMEYCCNYIVVEAYKQDK